MSLSAAAAVAWMAGPSAVLAATLSSVPMQGGMVMPAVSYVSSSSRLQVAMPVDVPQLTPLLVSNPADRFDPADPWFAELDPSRAGASFSRRYGFTMDVATDPLPAGRQMWIRKLSSSAGLKFFRYSASAPKALEPIFGTDGVTNAMAWSGTMFHPVVAAPPGTNQLTATFEVYLADSATGAEVPGAGTGPIPLAWSNVSDGRPALSILPGMIVAWPLSTPTNWVLESAAAVTGAAWVPVTNAITTSAGRRSVAMEPAGPQVFFRARYVP